MNKYTDDRKSLKDNKQNIRAIIGNNLKRLRKAHRDKQRDLEDVLGSNQPYISAVENKRADIKAYMIPILADRYGVYAESFFNEDGGIPSDLIARILRRVSLEADTADVSGYLNDLVDKIIKHDKEEELLKLFYASIDICYNYSKPIDHLEEINRVRDESYLDRLSYSSKIWGLEHKQSK